MTKKRKPITADQLKEYAEHYAKGLSSIKISKLAGVTSATIRNYLRKAGVQLRPRGRQKKNG